MSNFYTAKMIIVSMEMNALADIVYNAR